MNSPLPLLRRGLAAGALAGATAGVFALLLAEPLMDRAVRLEEERGATAEAHGHTHGAADAAGAVEHHADLFTRDTQHLGLVVTSVVAGLAIGVFFAVAHTLVHRGGPDERPWPRALALAAAGFTGVVLLPFLRYPANPPGVGDAGTVGERTGYWLAAVAIGVLGMVLAHQVHKRLTGRGTPVRQTAVALTVAAVLAVLFALPGNPDPVEVPATLLWDFRVLSLGSQVLLWAVLGAAFGGLGVRARRRAEVSAGQEPGGSGRSPAAVAPAAPVTAS